LPWVFFVLHDCVGEHHGYIDLIKSTLDSCTLWPFLFVVKCILYSHQLWLLCQHFWLGQHPKPPPSSWSGVVWCALDWTHSAPVRPPGTPIKTPQQDLSFKKLRPCTNDMDPRNNELNQHMHGLKIPSEVRLEDPGTKYTKTPCARPSAPSAGSAGARSARPAPNFSGHRTFDPGTRSKNFFFT
jgi:hypothetical protein